MSYSFKVLLKTVGLSALVLGLGLALVLGTSACGCDDDGTDPGDGFVTTTSATGPDTTDSVDVSALVGKWYCEQVEETLEFTSGGKVVLTSKGKELADVLTYTVDSDQIVVTIAATEEPRIMPYTLSGDTLTIVDPKYGDLTYEKSD